jgi:hypothetical protein
MGINIAIPFNETAHDPDHKYAYRVLVNCYGKLNVIRYFDNFDGEFKVIVMQWFVKIDDKLSDDEPRSYTFGRLIKLGNSLKIKETVRNRAYPIKTSKLIYQSSCTQKNSGLPCIQVLIVSSVSST